VPGAGCIGGHNGSVTSTRAGDSRWWTVGGLAAFAASSGEVLYRYLVIRPGELWQLDLEVYRDGAANLLGGAPVYDWLTGAPQFLPFTYPPFAAVAGIPLALMSFAVAGWVWSLVQLVLLWWGTGLAFRPVIERLRHRGGLAQGAVAAVLVQTLPVSDGFRFGQVNAVVVTLCLADLARPRPESGPPSWPRGWLIGLAAAIKLTPAAFWLHFVAARRWRLLVASVAAAATATVVSAAIAPSASAVFWTDALLDPDRLGPNSGVSNQSLRGALMRIGPVDETARSVLWVLGVIAVAAFGFWLSARLDRLGEQVAVVGAVGMVAVLISPVSWIHHWHWGIAVIGALLGDGRRRGRVLAALAVTVVLLLPLPWWGGAWQGHGPVVSVLGRVVEQSYTLLALASLVALWRLVGSRAADGGSDRGPGAGGEQGEHGEDGAHSGADPLHEGQRQSAQQGAAGQGAYPGDEP
jgi:alpha-1,2-mannosyltransferase